MKDFISRQHRPATKSISLGKCSSKKLLAGQLWSGKSFPLMQVESTLMHYVILNWILHLMLMKAAPSDLWNKVISRALEMLMTFSLHHPSLWPTPGAYLQSGSYSLSLLPNWNKFTQLQPEGLQTIHFLFPFLGKEPFPWGPRFPLVSVTPNCSSGWLHSQPASAEMLLFFHLKPYFNIKKSNSAKPESEERIRKTEE